MSSLANITVATSSNQVFASTLCNDRIITAGYQKVWIGTMPINAGTSFHVHEKATHSIIAPDIKLPC